MDQNPVFYKTDYKLNSHVELKQKNLFISRVRNFSRTRKMLLNSNRITPGPRKIQIIVRNLHSHKTICDLQSCNKMIIDYSQNWHCQQNFQYKFYFPHVIFVWLARDAEFRHVCLHNLHKFTLIYLGWTFQIKKYFYYEIFLKKSWCYSTIKLLTSLKIE